MNTAIYVVVSVGFIPDRIHINIAAFTDITKAYNFAETAALDRKMPVAFTTAAFLAFGATKTHHIWIEEFEEEKP